MRKLRITATGKPAVRLTVEIRIHDFPAAAGVSPFWGPVVVCAQIANLTACGGFSRTGDRAGDRLQELAKRTGDIMRIKGSVALVTGANRGFGRQLTEQLVARGAAKVYAAARKPETITTAGVVPIRIDITDPGSVAAAAAAATDVNLLINNAGTSSFNGLLTGPLDDIREQMEIHYFGTLTVTRVFAPCLRANAPAAILNVLSLLSWAHPANFGAYSAAKAAEWAQTDVVRDELAPSGVTVTALHVGFMDTDMVADVDAPKQDPAAVAAAALDGVENGLVEVLVGDRTRQVKAGLAADRGAVAPAQ